MANQNDTTNYYRLTDSPIENFIAYLLNSTEGRSTVEKISPASVKIFVDAARRFDLGEK